MLSDTPKGADSVTTSDTVWVSRAYLQRLELERRLDAGRRRIIARALRADGFTGREIARLTGVSPSQAYKDLG